MFFTSTDFELETCLSELKSLTTWINIRRSGKVVVAAANAGMPPKRGRPRKEQTQGIVPLAEHKSNEEGNNRENPKSDKGQSSNEKLPVSNNEGKPPS